MLKLLGILCIVVVVVIAVVFGIAATKPSTFRVERSTVIAAPPEKITPLIADFHNWAAWSPWEHLDPNMKTTYSGAPSGTGAVYEWEGNSKAGKGRMEILSATPMQTDIKLDFIKPFPGNDHASFTLTPEGNTTRVDWVMDGPMAFIPGKVFSVFIPMDKMLGGEFDRGLANMKSVAER